MLLTNSLNQYTAQSKIVATPLTLLPPQTPHHVRHLAGRLRFGRVDEQTRGGVELQSGRRVKLVAGVYTV